jgi:hypothetical protein
MMLTAALSVRAADSLSCSLWCTMTCPDSELYRPVSYCPEERHVANPPLNGRLVRRILARMARPSETAQVDIGPDEIAKSNS